MSSKIIPTLKKRAEQWKTKTVEKVVYKNSIPRDFVTYPIRNKAGDRDPFGHTFIELQQRKLKVAVDVSYMEYEQDPDRTKERAVRKMMDAYTKALLVGNFVIFEEHETPRGISLEGTLILFERV